LACGLTNTNALFFVLSSHPLVVDDDDDVDTTPNVAILDDSINVDNGFLNRNMIMMMVVNE